MANDAAEVVNAFVLDTVGVAIGPEQTERMQSQMRSVFGEHSALWWVLAWTTTFLMGLLLLMRLIRNRPYRVPHPNKTVGEGEPEVIIVGSGILGSSLAAALGMDGRRVTVIERDLKEPDRIVGEFLHAGGVTALRKLQLEDCLEGIDSPHYRGYVIRDQDYTMRTIALPTPPENVGGRGFHHGRLVQQLRKAAMNQTTVTYIEGVVLEILQDSDTVVGIRYRPKGSENEQVLKAPLVVVADGIYSKFRKEYTKDPPSPRGHFCGVMMHDAKQFIPKHLEMVLAEPSFVINYQVSTRCTRALVDLPTYYTEMPTDLKGYLKTVVYPKMPANLAPAFLEAVEADRFRVQALNFLPANPVITPGVVVLGDALNARHALTAGGMTAAFNDTLLARDMLRKVPDLYDYSTVMNLYRKLVADRKARTFSINVFAFSMYHLYASPDEHVKILKRGMFEYFAREGFCKKGAASIISILSPQPYVLMMHFFLSLLFAIGLNFKEAGLLKFPVAVYQGICMFWKGNNIMAPYIWGEIKTAL